MGLASPPARLQQTWADGLHFPRGSSRTGPVSSRPCHPSRRWDRRSQMPSVKLDFTHRFVPAQAGGSPGPALLLLHGTGGDENDLLSLGAALAPGAALLSPRGKVLENGMPRFFSRLREGVFDPREVEARAHELADFVVAAREMYPLGGKPIA